MADALESCGGRAPAGAERTFAGPEAPEQYARDRTFLLHHLRLELLVQDRERKISGTATYRLEPINDGLRELRLDAADLTIRSIRDDAGKVLEWEVHGESLTIRLPRARKAGDRFEIRIRYEARPKKGLYFKAPDKAYPKRARIVWTQGEDQDNRHWFPSYDYPNQRFTSEMIATVDERYEALSNGRLVKVAHDQKRKTKTFHWSLEKPHSSYLVALAVGEFDTKTWDVDGIPVQAYVPKGMGSFIDRCFHNVPDMVRFFGKVTGLKYPWPRYAQVCVPEFTAGGMENTSITLLYEYCMTDDKAYNDYQPESLLAHELAHQWFGDWLTTKSWGHIWLNEAFATYFDILWWEHFFGKDEMLMRIEEDRDKYFEEFSADYRRPIVTHKFVEPSDMFDRHTYEKGGSVLHMMRYVLGDDLWWKAIRHYVATHGTRNVETNDFKEAIEEATGRNLDAFFDQWLYHAGHPEFEVSWSWDDRGKQIVLKVKQVHEVTERTPLFRMPVDIEIMTDDRTWRERIQVERPEQEVHLDAPRRPRAVLFDPDDAILKKLTFKKEKQELLWQLAHAKDVWPRIEACKGLSRFLADDSVVDALGKTLGKDKFWGVKRAAAAALGAITSERARSALMGGAKDKDSRVRRAVYRALGKFRKDDAAFRALAKAYLEDGWYYPMETAAAALAETRHKKAFDTIVEGMDRPSRMEVVARGACMALANLRDQRGLEVLMERTAYGRPEMVRYGATWALGKLGSYHESRRDEVLDHLTAILRDPNYYAKWGAIYGLRELGYKKAIDELEKTAETELQAHLRTSYRLAIKAIREKHAEGAKRLDQQEELDKLSDETKELKAKLASLESRTDALAKRRR